MLEDRMQEPGLCALLAKPPPRCPLRYPEGFAQEALGHNSKAVHRAYAKRARVKIPSLEDCEKRAAQAAAAG